MPTIRVITAEDVLLPNTVHFPLQGSQYEYLPFNARVEFAVVSDATSPAVAEAQVTVYSGTDVLQQAGPMSEKAQPIYPDDFLLDDVAGAGERLSVEIRVGATAFVGAGVQTVVKITPL